MLATTRTGQFCTSLDVTLRQHGSGGKTHLGRIARRGDPYWPCRRSHLQCSDAYHLLHYDTGQLQPISFHWLFCSNKVIGFVRCTEKVIGPRRRRILSVGPVYSILAIRAKNSNECLRPIAACRDPHESAIRVAALLRNQPYRLFVAVGSAPYNPALYSTSL